MAGNTCSAHCVTWQAMYQYQYLPGPTYGVTGNTCLAHSMTWRAMFARRILWHGGQHLPGPAYDVAGNMCLAHLRMRRARFARPIRGQGGQYPLAPSHIKAPDSSGLLGYAVEVTRHSGARECGGSLGPLSKEVPGPSAHTQPRTS